MVASTAVLNAVLEQRIADTPDLAAVIDVAGACSFRQLASAASRFAERMRGHHRVLLTMPQRSAAVALLLACERLAIDPIAVPAILGATPDMAREFGASAIVSERGGDLEITEVSTPAAASRRDETPVVGILTSGTTGRPKCAMHTWSSLSGDVREKALFARTRWLAGYPVGHFAWFQVFAQCWFNGATLVMPADFSARTAIDHLVSDQVQYLCGTPTYVRQILLAASPEDWRRANLVHVTLGGEPVDQLVLDGIARAVPGIAITHTYASTELGAVLSVRDGREGFDAKLLDERSLKVVDGQLYVRRTSRSMLAYWEGGALDEWVPTGDLVAVEGGRVRFLGRANDIINVGGYKVPPTVVESAVRQVPGIAEARVVGHPSSLTGNIVKATIVVAPGFDPDAVKAELMRHCRTALPKPMVPRVVEVVDRIDVTPSQKIQRTSHAR